MAMAGFASRSKQYSTERYDFKTITVPGLASAFKYTDSLNYYRRYALPKNARRVTHRLTVEESDGGDYRRYDGTVRVIACIEDPDTIDRFLAHLRDEEQAAPALTLLASPPRARPETLPLFSKTDSAQI